MLQKRQADISRPQQQAAGGDPGPLLEVSYYVDILKRRMFAFALVFLSTLALGSLVVMIRPSIYLVEGKILLESPQIPSELVRSTVTALATERIQLIAQRILTRDNLLAIAKKFEVFGRGQADDASASTIVALMRLRTQIKPSDMTLPARSYEHQTIAFTVGFEHEQPVTALKVTNELITMILAEDLRTRTSLASETTRFLEGETKKLEDELSAIEVQLAELKRREAERAKQAGETQLASLRTQLAEKSTIYSDTHPDIKALKQKIAALERTLPSGKADDSEAAIDALERQQASLQKILEASNQKLVAARLGESLERGQRSERLEVIEQPTLPNAPVRPNRPKLLAIVLALALASGAGLVIVLEAQDDTIRRISDLRRIAEPQLIVAIPLIETRAERRRRKRRVVLRTGLAVMLISSVVAVGARLLPLDQLAAQLLAALKLS